MRSRVYSYFLVTLQFLSIIVLVSINTPLLTNPIVVVLFIIGLIIGLSAIRANQKFNIVPEIKDDATLVTDGVYKYVRHPMYFSLLVAFLGFFLFGDTYTKLLYALLFFSVYLKAKKEEKLWHSEDPNYANYKERTKMFIPFIL